MYCYSYYEYFSSMMRAVLLLTMLAALASSTPKKYLVETVRFSLLLLSLFQRDHMFQVAY